MSWSGLRRHKNLNTVQGKNLIGLHNAQKHRNEPQIETAPCPHLLFWRNSRWTFSGACRHAGRSECRKGMQSAIEQWRLTPLHHQQPRPTAKTGRKKNLAPQDVLLKEGDLIFIEKAVHVFFQAFCDTLKAIGDFAEQTALHQNKGDNNGTDGTFENFQAAMLFCKNGRMQPMRAENNDRKWNNGDQQANKTFNQNQSVCCFQNSFSNSYTQHNTPRGWKQNRLQTNNYKPLKRLLTHIGMYKKSHCCPCNFFTFLIPSRGKLGARMVSECMPLRIHLDLSDLPLLKSPTPLLFQLFLPQVRQWETQISCVSSFFCYLYFTINKIQWFSKNKPAFTLTGSH